MVIQVYTKPRTCHLVKYHRLLSSCISGCFYQPQNVIYSGRFRPLVFQKIEKTQRELHTISDRQLRDRQILQNFRRIVQFSHSSSFSLVILNGTSSTTAASLRKTRHQSCSTSSCICGVVGLEFFFFFFLSEIVRLDIFFWIFFPWGNMSFFWRTWSFKSDPIFVRLSD